MITINATGDTTLHTAGKYCPEDILVKVPAGGSSGSGGASVETCTVTFTTSDPVVNMPEYQVAYTGADMQGRVEQWKPNETVITVIKGSVITVYEWSAYSSATNATLLYSYTYTYAFRVDGDATLDFVM